VPRKTTFTAAMKALGGFKGGTFGIGPQIGFNFDANGVPIYTNLLAYYEFGVEKRTEGGGVFLTVNIPISALAKGSGK